MKNLNNVKFDGDKIIIENYFIINQELWSCVYDINDEDNQIEGFEWLEDAIDFVIALSK